MKMKCTICKYELTEFETAQVENAIKNKLNTLIMCPECLGPLEGIPIDSNDR